MSQPTAAIIIIGNEILSGRTQDTNTQWIALKLAERGVRLAESRIIPDEKLIIVNTVNELRKKFDYVFTTGGIGPTHDDITTECIAAAFGVGLELNEDAMRVMSGHHGPGQMDGARRKMAMIPHGAALIPNPVSAAPGFVIENVYVMAGIPRIMQAMMDYILSSIEGGNSILSSTVTCRLFESTLAPDFEILQNKYPAIQMGSYPHFHGGTVGLVLVLRSTDSVELNRATEELVGLIRKYGDEPRAVAIDTTEG